MNKPQQPDPRTLAQSKADKALELSAAYTRLFNTPDGQIVYGNLNQLFLVNNVPQNSDHAFWGGAKSVLVYVLEQIQHGAKYAHTRKP